MNALATLRRLLRSAAIAPVRLYQRFISPMMPPSCRYAPTCSNYAVEALSVHGIIKGTILSLWRLLRCNPWSYGGVDHVPPPGRWTPDPWVPPDDWVGHHSGESYVPMGLDATTNEADDRPHDNTLPGLTG
ncbi:membrane protein insertion efficiency factor YidD [Schaalia sp. Marseille-Q2122]|uniref:membrane protein insertion efficiency factor YidD n=1 Tax=Schaalia sp. Marseille-Q2122 TaxID=2736604 RepID=UPI001589ABC5|nr:membrane protein insertion efficiency factor YidD [Schaalia sp. Marseille-Q2122]